MEDKVTYGYRKVPAGEKKTLVHDHFDAIARRYDLADAFLSLGLHFLWKTVAVGSLNLKPGDLVLDLCGGTADLAIRAAHRIGPGGMIVVYDINRAMMEVGREKAAKKPAGAAIDFLEGDGERMSFPDGVFDAVMVGFGIRNMTHPVEGLKESFRVLKEGGRFMCLEFSLPVAPWFRGLYNFYSRRIMPGLGGLLSGTDVPYRYLHESIRVFPSPDELCAIMKEIGFSKTSFQRLTNGIAVVYRAERGRSTMTPGLPSR